MTRMTRERVDRATERDPDPARPGDGDRPRSDPRLDLIGAPAGVGNRQLGRWARTLSRDPRDPTKPITVYIGKPPPPPPPPPPPEAMKRATPENRRLAELIDTLDQLDDDALKNVREQAAAVAVGSSKDQPGAELKLEAAEFLTSRRRLRPLSSSSNASATERRLYVRSLIQEGLTDPTLRKQTEGSFKKALASFTHTNEIAADIAFFEKQAEQFGKEFKSQARQTANRLLSDSLKSMNKVLSSYGLPATSAMLAAERVYHGASVDKEADGVVRMATADKDINTPEHEGKRQDLANEVKNLKNQQLLVAHAQKQANIAVNNAPINGQGPAWDRVKETQQELARERAELARYWIEAEREHPIIAAFRRGEAIEKVDLGALGTDPVRDEMKTVVVQILPKIADIYKAQYLIGLGSEHHGISPLALAPVVALTKTNMFVPDRSLRDGVVKDLVDEAADSDPTWVKVLALALAIVTLIPSGGSSAILIGATGAALAAYSAGAAWQEYDVHKTLSNTDLDLARSLSTEEPSMTGFAVSLVSLGLEAIPLVHAFNTARRIKALMNEGKDVEALVNELNRIGENSPAKVKNLGKEAEEEAAAANREAARGHAHDPVPKPLKPVEPAAEPSALRPPPRDPELVNGVAGVSYTDAKKVQDDIAAELKQHVHGTVAKNPDMAWVMEMLAEAPDTSTNWDLLKILNPYYATVRDPDKVGEFAAFLYQRAAGRQITLRRALQDYVTGGGNPITIKTLKRSVLLEEAPFIDAGFLPGDPHGRFTHMFQEGLIDFVHGRGEGRRLRHLIAHATGPAGPPRRGREFWANVWDAFFDDETGQLDVAAKTHINRPEVLGPLLQKYLGLPL
jgi:hypothetical protein